MSEQSQHPLTRRLRRIMDLYQHRSWRLLFAGLLLVLLVSVVVLSGISHRAGKPPRFALKKVELSGSYKRVSYDFLSPNPFADGKAWIMAQDKKGGYHDYLFNLGTDKVEGVCEGQCPLVFNERDNIVLLQSREFKRPRPSTPGFVQDMDEFMQKIGLIKRTDRDRVEFWIQPGAREKPILVGTAYERTGAGGSEQVSPQANYYRVCTTCGEHLLIDLKGAKMRELPPARLATGGWWSNDEILFFTPDGDLMLYNAQSTESSIVFSLQQIQAFLQSHGWSSSSSGGRCWILSAWNGDHFELYLGEMLSRRSQQTKGWLIKIDKAKKELLLVADAFPFARLGHLNGAGTHYVYCGERETGDSNAVYVYELKTGQTLPLVPGLPSEQYFSLPNFHKDKIIYVQEDALWSMNLDGSGKRLLFPPKQAEMNQGE